MENSKEELYSPININIVYEYLKNHKYFQKYENKDIFKLIK